MEIAIPTAKAENFGAEFLRGWLRLWVAACNDFRQWERDELIKKTPSAETLAKHQKLSSSLIRLAHLLQAVMEDPEYPAREFLPEVQGKLMQLEEARDMIHDPMSDLEADHLLQKYFPDERGARSAA